jgi:hypothetical protein
MDTTTVVLLVLIAVISIVQTVFLVRLWLEGRRTAAQLDRLGDRVVRDLTPAMRDLGRAAGNGQRLSEAALLEVQRIDSVLQDAADSWSRTTGRLHELFVPNAGRLAFVASAWRLLRRGRAIYRWLRD